MNGELSVEGSSSESSLSSYGIDSAEGLYNEKSSSDFSSSEEDVRIDQDRDRLMASGSSRGVSVEVAAVASEAESTENEPESELAMITKSNVGLFVQDEDLLEHMHPFSEFVGGRKVEMKETLKSGKVRAGVDVKDDRMLSAMPDAAKIWLGVTKTIGKGCRQEFSKAFVKLLYAHVYLLNKVYFANKGLDPFPGRWCSGKRKVEDQSETTGRRKRGPIEANIVDVALPDGNATLSQPKTQPLGSYSILRCSTSIPAPPSVPAPAFGGLHADLVKR
ncbi:hypothetical protein R1sor_005545 [Riccia sorocarpa]|uniref:Uncharacterized protein n=1 Tax=Riccia sorocarpa TaxID=122646 RepID=A0ABD3HRF4_9MARC